MPEHISTLFVAVLKRYGIEPPAAVCETAAQRQKEFRFDERTIDKHDDKLRAKCDCFV